MIRESQLHGGLQRKCPHFGGQVTRAGAAFAAQRLDQTGNQERQLAGGNVYIGNEVAVVIAAVIHDRIQQHDDLDPQAFGQHEARAVVPGHGKAGGQLALLTVLAHLTNV